jgi:hypothetical protein
VTLTIEERVPTQVPDYNDKRRKKRFAIEREIHYRAITGQQVSATGIGKTINISSRGVCFSSSRRLAMGQSIELSVNWPVLLRDSCPMKLMIQGSVIRSSDGETVLAIERYEFRTQGSHGLRQPAGNMEGEAR